MTAHAFGLKDIFSVSGEKKSKAHEAWMKDAANAKKVEQALFEPASGKGLTDLVSEVLTKGDGISRLYLPKLTD